MYLLYYEINISLKKLNVKKRMQVLKLWHAVYRLPLTAHSRPGTPSVCISYTV